PAERQAKADGIASKAGFTGETIRTTRFDLHTRLRGTASGGLLTIYIEGDGFAWERRDRRSADPTPINPVTMEMAAADPAPAIAYLARPCQFTGGETARNCTSDLWTTARYSEEAVTGMSEALDALKRKADASTLALVGYSGGGTIAALLAQRRADIAWIKTVSSPLDTDAFTSLHKVTAMTGSLNPADKATTLAALPQIHYVGAKDDIAPVEINRRYLARMGDTRCAELVVIPGMDHVSWADVWASLTGDIPACR
ncbi:MAG TPA: alpha/beta hydrolase, partial [Rhodobiaceae bacterium]|nr:alpha/beta hydrolase [Rhodobiaceae bacterium]